MMNDTPCGSETEASHARDKAPSPLLGSSDLDGTFAWRDGRPITARQFLAHAAVQAEALPTSGTMINLCIDRYSFAVAFAAALLRGHSNLLPPDALPGTLERLRSFTPQGYDSVGPSSSPSPYGITDDLELSAPGLHVVRMHPYEHPHASPGTPTRIAEIAPDHLAAILLTSGSTGVPTPHAKTFGTLTRNIATASCRLAQYLQRPSISGLAIVATVPAQHSFGFESSILLSMLAGASMDSGRPYYPADIADALARLPRPRALVTTPFHLKALLQADLELPQTDLVLCATAPLSPQLALQSERAFGGLLVEIYGCTEAGQVASRRPVESEIWQTFDGVEIRREGTDALAQAGLADTTDDRARENTSERFIAEGGHVAEPTLLADILDLDDPTHFRLLGRANDLIHVAGRRSSLAHLDHHLNSIDGVEDGAFWVPPEVVDGVVRPVAFVVAPSLSAKQIVAALRTRLQAVFVPRRVVHLDSLPRVATGKLTRKALDDLAAAHLQPALKSTRQK